MNAKEKGAWRDWLRTLLGGAIGAVLTFVCGPTLGRVGDRGERTMRTPARIDFRVVEQRDDGIVIVRVINDGETDAALEGLQFCPAGRTLLRDTRGNIFKPHSLFLTGITGIDGLPISPVLAWSSAREGWGIDCFGYEGGVRLTPLKLLDDPEKTLNDQRRIPGTGSETFRFEAPAGWQLINPDARSTPRGYGECGGVLQTDGRDFAKILACQWSTALDPDPDVPKALR